MLLSLLKIDYFTDLNYKKYNLYSIIKVYNFKICNIII